MGGLKVMLRKAMEGSFGRKGTGSAEGRAEGGKQ